jgi:hypothetical protein
MECPNADTQNAKRKQKIGTASDNFRRSKHPLLWSFG